VMKESSWNITFFFVPYCDSDTRTNNNNSGTARSKNYIIIQINSALTVASVPSSHTSQT
jgi:hypothetical protein